jgi:hypothetical protein
MFLRQCQCTFWYFHCDFAHFTHKIIMP